MDCTRIIYLDPALISEAYIEITGKSPATRVTRTRQLSGNASAGLFCAGGTSSESRDFSVSTTQMLREIEPSLRKYPILEKPEQSVVTTLGWMRGSLVVGSQSKKVGGNVIQELYQFMIVDLSEHREWTCCLVTSDSYFSSGYDHLAVHKGLITHGMRLPVEALLRPLFIHKTVSYSAFAPVVILHA